MFKNPVKEFYSDYVFPDLPVIKAASYTDAINAAKASKTSGIFINTKPETVTDKALEINIQVADELKIVLDLNLTLKGSSCMVLSGKNYTVSDVVFEGGSTSKNPSKDHFITVHAQKIVIVNFTMKNVRCKSSDLDYFRVREAASNFVISNCLMDGKINNGVFLRLDFPFGGRVQNSVFSNIDKGSTANGGEGIRIATGGFEKKAANFVLENCYFSRCKSDPEIVSVKCSSVQVKKCIFVNSSGQKLVLRHAHDCVVDSCFFDGNTGIRVYGTKHKFQNIQLLNESSILLDNKSGSSYVVAKDCVLENIFYSKCKQPVINKGVNCVVRNLQEKLAFTQKDLLSAPAPPAPAPPAEEKVPL
jgi:hypothetical protein